MHLIRLLYEKQVVNICKHLRLFHKNESTDTCVKDFTLTETALQMFSQNYILWEFWKIIMMKIAREPIFSKVQQAATLLQQSPK